MSTLINATLAAIVYLYYIGTKPEKRDTVTDTKITWYGFGDKQPVPADKAAILLAHRDVWVTEEEFLSGKYKAPEVSAPPSSVVSDDIDLDDFTDGESEGEGDGEGEGDATVIEKIKAFILSIDTDNKKPAIDSIRAAMPGLTISVKDLNQAWKELNGE